MSDSTDEIQKACQRYRTVRSRAIEDLAMDVSNILARHLFLLDGDTHKLAEKLADALESVL